MIRRWFLVLGTLTLVGVGVPIIVMFWTVPHDELVGFSARDWGCNFRTVYVGEVLVVAANEKGQWRFTTTSQPSQLKVIGKPIEFPDGVIFHFDVKAEGVYYIDFLRDDQPDRNFSFKIWAKPASEAPPRKPTPASFRSPEKKGAKVYVDRVLSEAIRRIDAVGNAIN